MTHESLDQRLNEKYELEFSSDGAPWVYGRRKDTSEQIINEGLEIYPAKNTDEIVENADRVTYIEGIDSLQTHLIVDKSYKKPDLTGIYTIRTVYGIHEDQWEAESTFLSAEVDGILLRKRIHSSVFDSMEDAMRTSLGEQSIELLNNKKRIEKKDLSMTPDWGYIYRFFPKNSDIGLIEGMEVLNPKARFLEEDKLLIQMYGQEMYGAYVLAKGNQYNFYTTPKEILDKLPNVWQIKKSEDWREKDSFCYVSWKDANGKEKYCYVSQQQYTVNGFVFDTDMVYEPIENGDFSIKYHFYRPENTPETISIDRVYTVQSLEENIRTTYFLRPIHQFPADYRKWTPGEYEIMFWGIEDTSSRNVLNIGNIYPEMRMVATSRFANGVGAMTHPAFPIFSVTHGKHMNANTVGLELSHLNRGKRQIESGVEESRKAADELHDYYWYIVAAPGLGLVAHQLTNYNEYFHDNPQVAVGSYLTTMACIHGMMGVTPKGVFLSEEESERGSRLFVQVAREAGVDILAGLPDGQIKIKPDYFLWDVAKVAIAYGIKFRFPVDLVSKRVLKR